MLNPDTSIMKQSDKILIMSRGKNSGRYFEVIDGVHKDMHAIAYHRDQVKEVVAAKKILCRVFVKGKDLFGEPDDTVEKKLIDPKNLKLIGFID